MYILLIISAIIVYILIGIFLNPFFGGNAVEEAEYILTHQSAEEIRWIAAGYSIIWPISLIVCFIYLVVTISYKFVFKKIFDFVWKLGCKLVKEV